MTKRVCIEPGCPMLTRDTRCTEHQRARDKARGTRQERGYDAEHDRLRRSILKKIEAGERIRCWRCGISLGRNFHLDHNSRRDGYRGPACPPCNLQLAGQAPRRHPGG